MAMAMALVVPCYCGVAIPAPSPSASSSSASSSIASPQPFSRRASLIASLSATCLVLPYISSCSLASPSPFADYVDDFYQEEQRVIRLFQESTRSVVCIKDVELISSSSKIEDGIVEGTGSGFIWDRFGHIVTNYHVIAKLARDTSGKQQSQVSLLDSSGKVVTKVARLIGIDSAHDLAVLKIDVPDNLLQPISLGSSKSLKVGQSCYAIGNPYGYEHTLTTGVISGLGREIPSPAGIPIVGAIQTDAAINAGNSGGPLLDSFGRAIGINTASFTRQGSGMSSGVNFAIPIDLVWKLVPHLIVDGTLSSFQY